MQKTWTRKNNCVKQCSLFKLVSFFVRIVFADRVLFHFAARRADTKWPQAPQQQHKYFLESSTAPTRATVFSSRNLVFRKPAMSQKSLRAAEEGVPLHNVADDDDDINPPIVITHHHQQPSTLLLRGAILASLTLQTSAFTLLRRYSQAVLVERYTFGSLLLVGEFIKLVASVFAMWIKLDSYDIEDQFLTQS